MRKRISNHGKVRDKLAKSGKPRERIDRKMRQHADGSSSAIVLVFLADILGLCNEARLDTPGILGSPNREWGLTGWRTLCNRGASSASLRMHPEEPLQNKQER